MNRKELFRVVEEFYIDLYKGQQNLDEQQKENLDNPGTRVVNQGSEEMPDITTDEVRNTLKKMCGPRRITYKMA